MSKIYPSSALISREELDLSFRNYSPGLIGMWAVSGFVSYVVYSEMQDTAALYWYGILSAVTVSLLIRHYFFRDKSVQDTRKEVIIHTALIGILGCVWAYLPLGFLPSANSIATMAIVAIGCGFASGSVAMNSSCFPVFIAYTYPVMSSVIVALFLRDGFIFTGMAWSAIGFLGVLTWFSLTMRESIRRSATLRFDNDALVRKLRSALIQTDEANRAKSIFLASASHDLRQPLHALGLLTETLGHTPMNSQQGELQNHMLQAVDATRRMLDSLLNISKLDAGAISSDPKPFLLQTLFNNLENELAPLADEKGLIYRTRETILAVHSDPLIVELIVRNLIANAIRYSDKGGVLVACRRRTTNRVSIEVWDTGIGIPASKYEEVFLEFNQLANSERDSVKGFGLGLAIAQGLAGTLGSAIKVASRVGRGSVFSFELPISEADVIPDLDDTNMLVDFSGNSVLIIDDDQRVRVSMVNLLETWGCFCIAAESAVDAIAKLGNKEIDLLLVDYRLRERKTGREAIDDVRKHLGKRVSAIIITGDTAIERIQEAQATDALLLHKPASTAQLQRMMKSLLSQ